MTISLRQGFLNLFSLNVPLAELKEIVFPIYQISPLYYLNLLLFISIVYYLFKYSQFLPAIISYPDFFLIGNDRGIITELKLNKNTILNLIILGSSEVKNFFQQTLFKIKFFIKLQTFGCKINAELLKYLGKSS